MFFTRDLLPNFLRTYPAGCSVEFDLIVDILVFVIVCFVSPCAFMRLIRFV